MATPVNPIDNALSAKGGTQTLPKPLIQGVNIAKMIKKGLVEDGSKDLLDVIIHDQTKTLSNRETCTDMMTMDILDDKEYDELSKNARMAMLTYSFPYFIGPLGESLHKNPHDFYEDLEKYAVELLPYATDHLRCLLEKEAPMTHLIPNKCPIAGFYFRSPVRVYNNKGRRVYKMPEDPQELLKYRVFGNVNVYVLREHLADGNYRCYLMWRGTSNHYNAVPQYGKLLNRTQVFNFPEFDPIGQTFHPQGSSDKPLFYRHYCDIVDDVFSIILKALEFLGAFDSECLETIVTGHSQGGALTHTYCYMLHEREPLAWARMKFRPFASPMCSNYAACKYMEQMIIDSQMKGKYIETLNTDDMVLAQFKLGGKRGVAQTVRAGAARLVPFILNEITFSNEPTNEEKDGSTISMIYSIAKNRADTFAALFASGVMEKQDQFVIRDKRTATRIGKRFDLVGHWGELGPIFNGTFRLVYCKRKIDWNSEHIGLSHTDYLRNSASVQGIIKRNFEDRLYIDHVKGSLKQMNAPVALGLCHASDQKWYDMFLLENVHGREWWGKKASGIKKL